MVETDVRDDGEDRTDDVRTVEPAAETYLDDGDVDMLVGEILKGQCRGELEERGMEGLKEVLLLFHEVDDIVFGDTFAVDPDTLSEVDEVWGGIESHLIAVGLKDGGDGMGARALAVRPGHMDGEEMGVGMPEMFIEGLCVRQPFLIRRSTHMFENRGAIE